HSNHINDDGTVSVRYIVKALTHSGTRLRIDALFVEASLRRRHASDGQVENSEFEAVSAKMQDIEDTEAKKRGKLLHDQQQRQLEQFQAQLDQETAQLKTAIAKQQQLEQRLQQRQGLRAARVNTSNAAL